MWRRTEMRHCAACWKAADLIPSGVIGIFRLNPSHCTMALGSTQPLTEMSTRDISWGVEAAGARVDYLPTFLCQLYRDPGSLNLLKP
jgi:hypothetical protein